MRHAGDRDPGDQFDQIFKDSADRVTAAGGTPLENDTAQSRQDNDDDKEK